jgi:hypothetical protein
VAGPGEVLISEPLRHALRGPCPELRPVPTALLPTDVRGAPAYVVIGRPVTGASPLVGPAPAVHGLDVCEPDRRATPAAAAIGVAPADDVAVDDAGDDLEDDVAAPDVPAPFAAHGDDGDVADAAPAVGTPRVGDGDRRG